MLGGPPYWSNIWTEKFTFLRRRFAQGRDFDISLTFINMNWILLQLLAVKTLSNRSINLLFKSYKYIYRNFEFWSRSCPGACCHRVWQLTPRMLWLIWKCAVLFFWKIRYLPSPSRGCCVQLVDKQNDQQNCWTCTVLSCLPTTCSNFVVGPIWLIWHTMPQNEWVSEWFDVRRRNSQGHMAPLPNHKKTK